MNGMRHATTGLLFVFQGRDRCVEAIVPNFPALSASSYHVDGKEMDILSKVDYYLYKDDIICIILSGKIRVLAWKFFKLVNPFIRSVVDAALNRSLAQSIVNGIRSHAVSFP